MIVRETREATEASSTAWSFGILSGPKLESTTRTMTVNIATLLTDFLNYFKVSEEKWRNRRPPKNFFTKPVQMASAGYIFLTQWSRRVPSFLLAKLEGHVLQPMMNALNLTCPKCQCRVSSLANVQARQSRRNGRLRTWRVISASFQRMTGCSISFFLTGGWWVTENCWGCQTSAKCKRHNMGKNMHGSYDVECTICTMYKYGKKYMERSGCMIRACFLRFESHYPDLSGRWARWAILDSKLAKIIHRTKKCIIRNL